MLAGATAVLLFVGTGPIAYIRERDCPYTYAIALTRRCVAVMVVGALIFVLGIDLVKEALWDTRGRVNWLVLISTYMHVPEMFAVGPSM